LLSRIDLDRCAEVIGRATPVWLVAAFVSCSSVHINSTFKWRGILTGMGTDGGWWSLLRIYTIGHFASAFLPGTVGGDVLRWRLAGPLVGSYLAAAGSILIQRFTGVTMLVMLAAAAVVVDPRLATRPVVLLVGSGLAIVALAWVIALNRRLAIAVTYRTRRRRVGRPLRTLYRLQRVLRTFPASSLVVALGWSFLFYAGVGLVVYFSCLAFEVRIGLVEAISVLVVVCLLTMLPISLGGLGLKQAGDVYMLGLAGVDPAQALVVSLLRQMIHYAYVLIGGLLFVSLPATERV